MWWSLLDRYYSKRLQPTVNVEENELYLEKPYKREEPVEDYDGGGLFLKDGEYDGARECALAMAKSHRLATNTAAETFGGPN